MKTTFLVRLLQLHLMLFIYPLLSQTSYEWNKITSISVREREVSIASDSLLKKYVKINEISKLQFLAKRKTSVSYLTCDTLQLRKKKGVLSLPTQRGIRKFIDKDPFDETKQEYSYLGQIKFLGVYVVGGLYWEELDYKFVSKKDGKELQSFIDFPYISQNKKFIVCVYGDPYSEESQFELFSIVKNKVKSIFYTSFKNWMPAPEMKSFWGADGYFYIAALDKKKSYWDKDGNYRTDYKYLKLTIL